MPQNEPISYASTSTETEDEELASHLEDAPADNEQWLEESEELPRRPRRRLLAPVPVALLAVLLVACGFLAGVEVEKGQSTSSGSATASTGGLAAGFAALAKGGQPGGGSGALPGAAGSGAPSGFPGAGGGTRGGLPTGQLTSGQVSYVGGSTLYVTNSQGNTIKVIPTTGAEVTKTVKTKVRAINPGATVTVRGRQGKNGSIAASSISVSTSGTGSSSSGSGASPSGGSAPPALFGSGG